MCLAVAAILVCVICLTVPSFADGTSSEMYCIAGGEKISVLKVDGAEYLFLPSEAASGTVSLYTRDKKGREKVYFVANNEGDMQESFSPGSLKAEKNGVQRIEVYSQADADDGLYEHERDINVMCGENIGTVYLHSSDPEKKGRSFVDVSKSNGQTGSALITDSAGEIIYDGKLDQIRARGSSSFKYYEKKPYQIKLAKKASLIDGTKKGKTWVLIAAAIDYLKLNDYVGKQLAYYAGEPYAPAETPVNLYYDGEYRGVYLLSEKNQIKPNRIDISDMEEYYEEKDSSYGDNIRTKETYNRYGDRIIYQKGLTGPVEKGGYLIEMSGVDADESNKFTLKSGLEVNIKSPELSSKASVKYISEYMQEFEDAVWAIDSKGEHTGRNPYTGLYYYDYCDMDSLIREYMIQTILSNGDGFSRSTYFYKDKGDIMYCGPVWDTDLALGMGWNDESDPNQDWTSHTWAGHLLKIPGFRAELRKAWNEKYSKLMASMAGYGNAMPSIYEIADILRPNVKMDSVLWPVKYRLASPRAGYPGKSDDEKNAAYVKAGRKSKFVCWNSSMSYDDILEVRMDWLRAHLDYFEGYFAKIGTGHVHQLGKVVKTDGSTHTRVCTTCGAEVTEDCIHLASPVNSSRHTAKRSCMVCGSSVSGDTKCVYDIVEKQAVTAKSPKIIKHQCSVCRQTKVQEITLSKGDRFEKGDFKYKVTVKDKSVSVIKAAGVKKAVIPGTVTYGGVTYKVRSVGAAAFRNRTKMTSLKVGRNVRTIGKNAFRGCTGLKTVEGASNVRTIGAYAFYGDRRMTKIVSLKSCTSIGKKAFYGCKGLKNIGSKKKGVAVLKKKIKTGKSTFSKSGIKKIRKVL